MNTKVIFTATLEVAISATWQDSAPLEQITRDAEIAAKNRIVFLQQKGFSISDLKATRVILAEG
jgi:hypothetical protein